MNRLKDLAIKWKCECGAYNHRKICYRCGKTRKVGEVHKDGEVS